MGSDRTAVSEANDDRGAAIAFGNMGNCYAQMGEDSMALKSYRLAIKAAPYDTGQIERAISLFVTL